MPRSPTYRLQSPERQLCAEVIGLRGERGGKFRAGFFFFTEAGAAESDREVCGGATSAWRSPPDAGRRCDLVLRGDLLKHVFARTDQVARRFLRVRLLSEFLPHEGPVIQGASVEQ